MGCGDDRTGVYGLCGFTRCNDGQTSIGIAVDKASGVLYVRLTKPVEWIGLDTNSAMQFLTAFAKNVSDLTGMLITVSVGDDDDDSSGRILERPIEVMDFESGLKDF
jgi:hypothetical protein